MRRKTLYMGMGLLLVFSLAGCQKNPDSSLVVNKDMDNLIEQAQNTEGAADIEDMRSYDSWQTTIQDDSLGVNVTVDAKVDIPETSQMSVLRVEQAPITQEQLTQIQKELMGSATVYDGSILSVRDRATVEQELKQAKQELNDLKNGNYSQEMLDGVGGDRTVLEEEADVYINEAQLDVDALQQEYETAPEKLDWRDYVSDGQLKKVADRDITNAFYEWQMNLNPNGEDYYGITDAADGNYQAIFVQNSPEYGNCLRYRSGRHGYQFVAGAYTGADNLEKVDQLGVVTDFGHIIARADQGFESSGAEDGKGDETTQSYQEIMDEPTTISKQEAKDLADAFLQKTGLTDFQYSTGDLYDEKLDVRYDWDLGETGGYRKVYILQYMRSIDGALVTYDAASKHSEGWDGDDYSKKDWSTEVIQFRINDSGIVGFDYNAPLQTVETVVDHAALKSFDEVKSTFESMVVVMNAQDTKLSDEKPSVTIKIDRVILGYARISEANSYDTGLLVPVWDFKGTVTDSLGGYTSYGSVMTVNAIDGTIIDRTLGY